MVIKPTPGRVVWFYPSVNDASLFNNHQPLAALVTYVHSDRMVNLAVFDVNGGHHAKTSIRLEQEGDDIAGDDGHCGWMPYQVGQAKKHEGDNKTA